MRSHSPHDPTTGIARLTGLAYLGIIVTGVFAEFAVRGSLVADDDAITTATNIATSPAVFGVGIGADVLMIALDVTVAVGLFGLLRHVDRRLALTTTALRLLQGGVILVNLLNLVSALGLSRDAVGADGTVTAGIAQDALDAVERHALGYDVGLIAFGLSCLVLGRLLWIGTGVSRLLALGMGATGVVYLAGSCAALFAPGLGGAVEPFYVIPLVAELTFAVRLVARGLSTVPPVPSPIVALAV